MASGFTRYRLRVRAEKLEIELRYGQIATYIEKGLLPDPADEIWTEKVIVPRFLRVHELETTARSLDRRVVILHMERYPIALHKLRDAMIGMLPTIKQPVRKMARVDVASRWFDSHFGGDRRGGTDGVLPVDWHPPRPASWAAVLGDVELAVFTSRLGIVEYSATLLGTIGAGTPHTLKDLPAEEKLVLLLIRDIASRGVVQEQARERRDKSEGVPWFEADRDSAGPRQR